MNLNPRETWTLEKVKTQYLPLFSALVNHSIPTKHSLMVRKVSSYLVKRWQTFNSCPEISSCNQKLQNFSQLDVLFFIFSCFNLEEESKVRLLKSTLNKGTLGVFLTPQFNSWGAGDIGFLAVFMLEHGDTVPPESQRTASSGLNKLCLLSQVARKDTQAIQIMPLVLKKTRDRQITAYYLPVL